MNRNRIYTVLIFSLLFFSSARYVFPQNTWLPRPARKAILKTEVSGHSETRYIETKNTFAKNSLNYFKIDETGRSLWNGKHWQPADYPLKVFVKNVNSVYFKQIFRSYVDYAMSVWEAADPRIKFEYSKNSSEADITIEFEDNLITKYDDNFLGITDYKLEDDKKIDKSYIEVGLLKFNDERVSDGEVKATIIHEFGHALGLGHSGNETDIMFPFINPFTGNEMGYDDLSSGDIKAVRSVVDLGFGIYVTKNVK